MLAFPLGVLFVRGIRGGRSGLAPVPDGLVDEPGGDQHEQADPGHQEVADGEPGPVEQEAGRTSRREFRNAQDGDPGGVVLNHGLRDGAA